MNYYVLIVACLFTHVIFTMEPPTCYPAQELLPTAYTPVPKKPTDPEYALLLAKWHLAQENYPQARFYLEVAATTPQAIYHNNKQIGGYRQSPEALRALAYMYHQGIGLDKDLATAAHYYWATLVHTFYKVLPEDADIKRQAITGLAVLALQGVPEAHYILAGFLAYKNKAKSHNQAVRYIQLAQELATDKNMLFSAYPYLTLDHLKRLVSVYPAAQDTIGTLLLQHALTHTPVSATEQEFTMFGIECLEPHAQSKSLDTQKLQLLADTCFALATALSDPKQAFEYLEKAAQLHHDKAIQQYITQCINGTTPHTQETGYIKARQLLRTCPRTDNYIPLEAQLLLQHALLYKQEHNIDGYHTILEMLQEEHYLYLDRPTIAPLFNNLVTQLSLPDAPAQDHERVIELFKAVSSFLQTNTISDSAEYIEKLGIYTAMNALAHTVPQAAYILGYTLYKSGTANTHLFNRAKDQKKELCNAISCLEYAQKRGIDEAKNYYAYSLYALGSLYYDEKEYTLAREYLEKAVELGQIPARRKLSYIYLQELSPLPLKEALEKGTTLFDDLEINNPEERQLLINAYMALAEFYDEDHEPNLKLHVYNLGRAAELEHAPALRDLGLVCLNGNLSKCPPQEALKRGIELLEKAVALNDVEAHIDLARIFHTGSAMTFGCGASVPYDEKKAIEYVLKAIQLNNNYASAHHELGRLYANKSKHTPQYSNKAEACFKRAIALGRQEAFFDLAELYNHNKRYQDAFKYYKKAAENEQYAFVEPCYQAFLALNGFGAEKQDLNQAIMLLLKALSKGGIIAGVGFNQAAYRFMERMYLVIMQVVNDHVEAYVRLSQANPFNGQIQEQRDALIAKRNLLIRVLQQNSTKIVTSK